MKTVYEILGIHKSRDKTTENVDNSADTVSYTHLDVYKRQLLYIGTRWMRMSESS